MQRSMVQLVREKITVEELKKMAKNMLGDFVKAVVDIEQEIMAVDAELHADEESILLEQGSKQEHLWGINIYPEFVGDKRWIEFDSMINLRPSFGNNSRSVGDQKIQKRIINVVNKLVAK